MFGIGPMELVVILVMALLVLGPKRMPELARTLGRGLGEFRRASSELRQSLALDDLQNELRDGLAGKNTIRKPSDEGDRPAQAGDDLAPGKAGEKADEAGGGTTAGEETTAANPTPTRHPGELPLDEDPHAHHDQPEDQPEDLPEDPPKPAEPAPGTASFSSPADSALGNVPVGGATSTAATPSGAPAKASSTGPTSVDPASKERG